MRACVPACGRRWGGHQVARVVGDRADARTRRWRPASAAPVCRACMMEARRDPHAAFTMQATPCSVLIGRRGRESTPCPHPHPLTPPITPPLPYTHAPHPGHPLSHLHRGPPEGLGRVVCAPRGHRRPAGLLCLVKLHARGRDGHAAARRVGHLPGGRQGGGAGGGDGAGAGASFPRPAPAVRGGASSSTAAATALPAAAPPRGGAAHPRRHPLPPHLPTPRSCRATRAARVRRPRGLSALRCRGSCCAWSSSPASSCTAACTTRSSWSRCPTT